MFFKHDKLPYYFMGNLAFKREGKGQQEMTGGKYLRAVRNEKTKSANYRYTPCSCL